MFDTLQQVIISSISRLLGFVDYGFLLIKLLGPLQPRFFGKGYGNMLIYKERWESSLAKLESKEYNHFNELEIEWGNIKTESKVTIQQCRFLSPLSNELPPESSHCHFQLVRPIPKDGDKPDSVCVIMLPATAEMHTFGRLVMARHLAIKYGWTSAIITAPYYGVRQPKDQTLFFINSVTDMLLQSQGILEETSCLASHFLSQSPETKVCFTGFSWGAAISGCAGAYSLLAGLDGKRMACAMYVGCPSPSIIADGIMVNAIQWKSLRRNQGDHPNETRQQLYDELCKAKLDLIQAPNDNRLAVVKGYAMEHDVFIPKKHAMQLEQQARNSLFSTFQLKWHMGGHAFAALLRPILHYNLIVDTVQSLVNPQT